MTKANLLERNGNRELWDTMFQNATSNLKANGWKRVRHCQAKENESENGEYIVLRSYDTIVGLLNKRTGLFLDGLRYVYGYTATSNQHIAKFKADHRSEILTVVRVD